MSNLWAFTKAFREHWWAAMSGGFSIPFAAASAYFGAVNQNRWAAVAFAALAFGAVWFAAYIIWRTEYERVLELRVKIAPRLEIIYDHTDSKSVRLKRGPYQNSPDKGDVERYWIGIQNKSDSTTLYNVTLRAREGVFVGAIAEAQGQLGGREPIIAKYETLDPGSIEYVELLGLPAVPLSVGQIDASISKKTRFVLEARAKDTPTIAATFEYDPATVPHIKRIG